MKEVKNIIVPCWVYENDQGIPHDVCDYFVNKYQNTKTTSGKTDGKNKELIDKKVSLNAVREVSIMDLLGRQEVNLNRLNSEMILNQWKISKLGSGILGLSTISQNLVPSLILESKKVDFFIFLKFQILLLKTLLVF